MILLREVYITRTAADRPHFTISDRNSLKLPRRLPKSASPWKLINKMLCVFFEFIVLQVDKER